MVVCDLFMKSGMKIGYERSSFFFFFFLEDRVWGRGVENIWEAVEKMNL